MAILLAGFVAYLQLPVSALPEVDYPIIQVQTYYPGASPNVMAQSVTGPLERQFGQIPGLQQMTSISSGGGSIITLEFSLEESIDVAQQDVQAAINAAYTFLPQDLPNPPIYAKVNPADAPILTLSLTSDTVPLQKVEDLADTVLAQKISQLSGVGLVSIAGGQKPAVRIQANPAQLASYGLSLEDIRTAIGTANVDQAKGSLNGPRQAYTIGDNDQLMSADDYDDVIVAYRNNSPVRLKDVATVVDSAENLYQAAWMGYAAQPAHTQKQDDGTTIDVPASQAYVKPAIIINIQRQPGANIIGVVDRVQALLPKLRESLPAGVELKVLTDRTNTIRASIKDVHFELLLTIGLVDPGDLPLPAFFRRHHHPCRCRAAVHRRHLRHHVPARLFAQQPFADGAHHLDRLRRRRRHRHDREHRPLPRDGRQSTRRRAQGLRADRLHDSLADRLAHRRAHPAALHGRHRRPALPRVRRHPRRYHPRLGRRLPHAHADDVRAPAQAQA